MQPGDLALAAWDLFKLWFKRTTSIKMFTRILFPQITSKEYLRYACLGNLHLMPMLLNFGSTAYI